MTVNNIELQIGTVLGTTQTKDSTGTFHPTIQVKSLLDGATLDVPLAPAAWEQSLPIPGYLVCFIRMGNFQNRILKVWGRDEDFTRKGYEYGLLPGEVFIQSPSGLGYIKIDSAGRVYVTNGDQTSDLQMTEAGAQINTNRLLINATRGQILEFGIDGSISLSKVDPSNGTVITSLSIADGGEVVLSSTKDVKIKAPNIYLDGNVWAGQNAGDPQARLLFGDVVTGGPMGSHPFDLSTGTPIRGVSAVKAG